MELWIIAYLICGVLWAGFGMFLALHYYGHNAKFDINILYAILNILCWPLVMLVTIIFMIVSSLLYAFRR